METQCSKYPQFSFLRNTYIHPSLERTDSKYVQMELCQRNSWGLWECSQTSYCATWMHQPTLCKGIHRSKVYPFHLLKCIHLNIHIPYDMCYVNVFPTNPEILPTWMWLQCPWWHLWIGAEWSSNHTQVGTSTTWDSGKYLLWVHRLRVWDYIPLHCPASLPHCHHPENKIIL